MDSSPHNLPTLSTSFVGRQIELDEILSLLGDEYCRLLSLVGPGGIGKSRLALQVGGQLVQTKVGAASDLFTDGVYFVPLQSVSSPDQLTATIANTLEWGYYEGVQPLEELLAYLQNKRLLLILDNFEHLLAATTQLHEILLAAPNIKLLITSRTLLNLTDEHLYDVRGMDLPHPTASKDLQVSDAIRLFAERAHRVRYDFSLADEEQNVLRICQAVEGLPLAIELAATWLRRLTCGQVADEIERGLDLLSSDEQGISERHRTMRVVFDHSWGRLTESEQNILAALSVFRGGLLREAAEEITGATLPILSSFIARSLIRMTATGRYAIHELQRQYAAERLDECPEYQERVHDQHSKYYLGLVSIPIVRLVGEGNRPLLTAIEAELDNILAAWYWAVDHRRIPVLHRAMKGLCWFLWLSTYHHEGERAFRHAIDTLSCEEAGEEERIAFAYALTWYGSTNIWFGHAQEANRRLQESVSILREIPSGRPELGAALGYLGWSTYIRSEIVEATALFLEAAEICKETEQFVLLAWLYCMLGDSAQRLSTYQEQEQWYQQALQFGREIGDQRTVSNSLHALGKLATQRGKYAEANHYLNEGLSVARRHDISAFVRNSLVGLGQLSAMTGDYEVAFDYLQQSLAVARLWGDSPEISHSLITQAQVRTGQRMYEEAAGLFQEASELQVGSSGTEQQLELLRGLGNLALNSGSYAQAQVYHNGCLTLSQRSGDRLSEAWAFIGLALVDIRQNESVQVIHHLIAALDTGLSIDMAPVLLDAICASAEMFSIQGDCAYAAQLAMLVNQHGASTAETQQRAAQLLEYLVSESLVDNAITGKQGDTPVDIESVVTRLIEELQRLQANITNANMAEQPLIEPLSDRELEVLRMVADGKSNREIGRELYLALGTVKSHLHHIFQKLDVRSRTQAVARAIELHLL